MAVQARTTVERSEQYLTVQVQVQRDRARADIADRWQVRRASRSPSRLAKAMCAISASRTLSTSSAASTRFMGPGQGAG
jgi:type VI protein secretion system component VasF